MKMFSSEIFHNFQSTAHYEMSHSRTFSPYHITEWTITQHNITLAELYTVVKISQLVNKMCSQQACSKLVNN